MDEQGAVPAATYSSVAHLTSAHSRDDVRIFLKECRSVAGMGHRVTLVVADGRGPATIDGVRIVDAGRRPRGRLGRAALGAARVFAVARKLRADIYHIHDPELIPWALLLRAGGAKVVYDAHEHVPEDILSKHYLPSLIVRPLSAVAGACELAAARRMSGIVAATPHILERFAGLPRPKEGVYNFPMSGELAHPTNWERRESQVCYVGGVSVNRGIRQIAQAAQWCRTRVVVAGPLWDGLAPNALADIPGWERVSYLGKISRPEVADLMGRSRIGIVTFLPTQSHINSLPNKLFEYMSAGIPVVASNFPLWRDIVDATACGLCVDPADPRAIAEAIDRLAEDEEFALACGQNGMRAVATKYNWDVQALKLGSLYQRLRPRGSASRRGGSQMAAV